MTELPWHQAHEAYCNGDKSKPVGDPGCSCRAGSTIRALAAQLREAEAKLEQYEQDRVSAAKIMTDASGVIATLTAQVEGPEKTQDRASGTPADGCSSKAAPLCDEVGCTSAALESLSREASIRAETVEALKSAVIEMTGIARHYKSCGLFDGDRGKCDCGLTAALDKCRNATRALSTATPAGETEAPTPTPEA